MYFFDDYFKEVLTKKAPDYVAFSHAGHGINSYALTYQLVDGPLAIMVQVGWGGAYGDKAEETRAANDLFHRCGQLVLAAERAKAGGLTGASGRLIVIESDMREQYAWGWLDQPLRGAAASEWFDEHAVPPAGDSRRPSRPELPTVAALEWLNSNRSTGSR